MIKKTIPHLFAILFFAFIWGSSWQLLDKSQKVKGVITNLSPSEIISLTNLERTKSRLTPLKPNQALSEAALLKAEDMINQGYFAHLDNQGNGSWNFIENQGYIYQYAGENLAKNFSSADSLVSAWMKSDSHRNNLLSKNYTNIGVAVLEDNDQVYVVQLLASPLPLGSIDVPDSGTNFSFSFPISGNNNLNPYIKLFILSFLVSLLIYIISYKLFLKFLSRHFKLKIPNIRHWQI